MIKKSVQAIVLNLAKGIIFLIGMVPHRLCLAVGAALGRLVFSKNKSRRKVAIDNLTMIYGETMSTEKREQVARDNFAHLGSSGFELLHVAGKSRKQQDKLIRISGQEHLQAALAQGQGAVVFSAHMGNFYLMGLALNRISKVKFIFRDSSGPLVSRIYCWVIARLGIEVIKDNPRNVCAMQSFLHLRSGGILGILIDQVETGGLYVDFMGKPAGSTLGAANMTLRRKAPLIPVHCYRTADNKTNVEIEPEFVIEREGKTADLLEPAVAGMNKVVEKWVRKNPSQWFWGHRRWRSWRK
jgi:Kdo2-lipid IVA lauroyltransferase/acyltransferase